MAPEVGVIGVRVFDNDVESRQSDAVLGTSSASVSLPSTKKQDTELYSSRSIREDTSRGLDHGTTNGSVALVSGFEGKEVQRKMGKLPRNGSGSYRRLKLLQPETVPPPAEHDSAKIESGMLGSHFPTCSNADKFQTVKQRNSINGRRGDRRNSRVPIKSSFDTFSSKTPGGINAFGMYGLKPDVHDISKLMEDISLDELLDGTVKCPTFSIDKEKKRTANVKDNVLDAVRKVCSLIFLQGTQQSQQTEEVENASLSASPTNNNVEDGSDGDGSIVAGLSQSDKDLESSVKGETSANLNDIPLYRPRDLLERLALPPPKDLESLLHNAVEPAASMKLTDSRFTKQQSSHGVSLPSFTWSHNFNGYYKSNNDTPKTSNKSTCFSRWVRISNAASFIGRSADNLVDLDSLTYDDSLVPAGQLKYRLPEVENMSNTDISQRVCQQDNVSPVACPPASLPPSDLHSPKVLSAARTLCDMASSSTKHNSGGLLKWPKRPSQKSMKARKSRLIGIPEEEFPTPNSETTLAHIVRDVEYGSSSKKPKLSRVGQREEYSPVQAVIGLSSPPIPKSNRSSPGRLTRDSVSEAKHLNGSFPRSSFMGPPPPPRVPDRGNQNPHKSRKTTPMDWNRSRS